MSATFGDIWCLVITQQLRDILRQELYLMSVYVGVLLVKR